MKNAKRRKNAEYKFFTKRSEVEGIYLRWNLFKKGDLSMQFIALAVLALIFLIVVAFVMTGNVGIFSKGLSDCENKAGWCMTKTECSSNEGTESGFTCAGKEDVCCLNTCKGKGGTCSAADACASGEERIYLAACPSEEICCK